MKNHSLFGLDPSINPFYCLDRWLNPYKFNFKMSLKEHPLEIEWTKRAQQEFVRISTPLIVEMQLYFSCVIKKRVLFSQQVDFKTTAVNDHLQVAFHPVEAASCDPIEFAKNFPAKKKSSIRLAQKKCTRVS